MKMHGATLKNVSQEEEETTFLLICGAINGG
jgi:hypothetical protein